MASLRSSPVLTDAADLLDRRAAEQFRRLGTILKRHVRALDLEFGEDLERSGLDARQKKALLAITAGAAARLAAEGRTLSDFFEQVGYNGRRLALLDLSPGAVVSALRSYERLASIRIEKLDPAAAREFDRASEPIGFSTALTVNNAFYQVREAETRAFYALVEAELESGTRRELLQRSLEILTRFCQAGAACLVAVDEARGIRLSLASGEDPPPAEDQAPALGRIGVPRHIRPGPQSGRLLLHAGWSGKYESVWSVPLSGAGMSGAIQFGFSKHYEWLPREMKLLSVATERLLLASEKLRLAEDLAAREEQVRNLAAHMVEIEERERRRISRELHDDAGQLLLYLRLQLEVTERLVPANLGELKTGISEARGLIQRTICDMRRLISDLSPAVLEQFGLAAAVRQLVNRFRQLHGIQTRLHLPKMGRLPGNTEIVVYRLAQECLTNIAKHASASHVNLSVTTADGLVRLRVEDNGVGFRVKEAYEKKNSLGLAGMRERVMLAGGQFDLDSRPGAGAVVTVELPLPVPEKAGANVARRRRLRAG